MYQHTMNVGAYLSLGRHLFLQTLMYLRLFAHILVGFLIGALYYDIGNDGAKVLSNLGFLFFNMLFLMYTSMTITILSCKYCSTDLSSHQSSLFHQVPVQFSVVFPFTLLTLCLSCVSFMLAIVCQLLFNKV
jgi:hypothetical protein